MAKGAKTVTDELTEIGLDQTSAEIFRRPYDRQREEGPGDIITHQGQRYRILSLRLVNKTVRTLLKPVVGRK